MLYTIKQLIGPSISDDYGPYIFDRPCGINSRGDVVGWSADDWGMNGIGVIWPASGPMFPLAVGSYSVFVGITNNGDAVGGRGLDKPTKQIPILKRGGAVSDVTQEIGVGNVCQGINDAGQICGSNGDFGGAFIFNPTTRVVTPLGFDFATAINQAGDIAGNIESPRNGIIYHNNGTVQNLGPNTGALGRR